MSDKEPLLKFDFETYLATLMDAMDMGQAPMEIQQDVTLQLGRQLSYRLMSALTLNFGDQDWAGLAKSPESDEMETLLERAIERNPRVKTAVLKELDDFYAETMEAYNAFKQPNA